MESVERVKDFHIQVMVPHAGSVLQPRQSPLSSICMVLRAYDPCVQKNYSRDFMQHQQKQALRYTEALSATP
jgi:hypothetical protein